MKEILEQAIGALCIAARHAVHEELETEYATSAGALRDLLGRVEAASEMKPLYGEIVGGAFQVSGGGSFRMWVERVE